MPASLRRSHPGTVTSTAIDERWRTLARWVLGGLLLSAGAAHLGTQRDEFLAQVPDWVPVDPDAVVVVSGLVELALGVVLIVLRRWRMVIGGRACRAVG